jgi:hypothetical protein
MNPMGPLHLFEDEVFWGELAPTEHLVHLYENESAFFQMLEGFVAGGLSAGEAVIVIATQAHRDALNQRLRQNQFDLQSLRAGGRYLDLSAENCLATFMKDGWPDVERFNKTIGGVINQVKVPGRRIRAFGEMVALLWADGHAGATVQLEHLWNEFRRHQNFPLFCAYPKAGFTVDANESLETICAAHTKVIHGRGAVLQKKRSLIER